MTDAQFYKSFVFNLFERRRTYITDYRTTSGCPHHYIARMISGTAKIYTDTQTLLIKEGDIFYIPKGIKYRSFWYPGDEAVTFYSFGFDFFPCNEHTFYKMQIIHCNDAEKKYMSELESDITVSPLSIGRLYSFLGKVCEIMQTEPILANQIIINKALAFMHQNIHCTVGDVARYCGISESGLFVKFRKHLNQTPIQALHRILADMAGELLTTSDMTIEEISDRLGFSSSSYFSKVFYKQTGKTPSSFRKETQSI